MQEAGAAGQIPEKSAGWPTRERGRPARTTLAKPRPFPRPGLTGKDARALLRPGPCGSHRHGGRVRHRRETEQQPKGEDAGGTPALPGGPLSSRLPFKGESAQPNWPDGRLRSRFDHHFVAPHRSPFFCCFSHLFPKRSRARADSQASFVHIDFDLVNSTVDCLGTW